MIVAALALITVSVGSVRAGWGGRRYLAAGGWAGVLLGLALLGSADGAWGIAVGTVAGMAAALAVVLWAAWTSPAMSGRPPRQTPSVHLSQRWPDMLRRCGVFLLTVPVAFAAAQWLAFGAEAAARRAGADATNSTVAMLLLQPVLWAVLMAWQMTRARLAGMVAPPLLAALLGTLLWGAVR